MKVKYILDMNDEQDSIHKARIDKSLDMALILWDFNEVIRGLDKYPPEDLDHKTIEHIRTKFIDILEEYNLSLNELIN
jgi:hypothetical protein